MPKLFKGLEQKLQGQPDYVVTSGLVAVAVLCMLVAVKGPATLKVALLAVIIF